MKYDNHRFCLFKHLPSNETKRLLSSSNILWRPNTTALRRRGSHKWSVVVPIGCCGRRRAVSRCPVCIGVPFWFQLHATFSPARAPPRHPRSRRCKRRWRSGRTRHWDWPWRRRPTGRRVLSIRRPLRRRRFSTGRPLPLRSVSRSSTCRSSHGVLLQSSSATRDWPVFQNSVGPTTPGLVGRHSAAAFWRCQKALCTTSRFRLSWNV